MEYRNIILRDAKMCAYAAGNVEHFKYLMRSLGYIFKAGAWMEVQAPGCKYYHRLEKLDEMFAEEKLKYYVDFPYMVQAYYYSKDVRKIKHNSMSAFQQRYYAKMYRLRIVEQKRFSVKGVKFTEELKKFHQLQDEYLMLVRHDIRSITDLLNYRSLQEEKVQWIEDRQQELYRLNSSKKRSIKTEEQLREYQQWHLDVQKELDDLKQQKKDAKYQRKLAEATLNEKLDTAILDVSEMEPVVSNSEIVIPKVRADNLEIDNEMVIEDTEPTIGVGVGAGVDSPYEIIEGTDKKENGEGTKRKELSVSVPPSLQEYKEYSLQEKIALLRLQISDTMTSIFEKVKQYFESNGFDVSFDELYEAAKQLTEAVQKDATEDRAEKVVCELELHGPYPYLATKVKAGAFKFDVSDTSGNLKLFINVLNKLGVKMENDKLYEEYQKIYDETVNMSIRHDEIQNKMWDRGRGR